MGHNPANTNPTLKYEATFDIDKATSKMKLKRGRQLCPVVSQSLPKEEWPTSTKDNQSQSVGVSITQF